MPKREWVGEPLDLTDTDEAPSVLGDGETVDVADDEDPEREERFDALPSAVDPEGLTPMQIRVLKLAALHRDASYDRLANLAECSGGYVGSVLRNHWPERALADPEPGRDDVTDPDELTETRKRVLINAARDPHATNIELAERSGCSETYVSRVLRDFWPDRMQQTPGDPTDKPALVIDLLAEADHIDSAEIESVEPAPEPEPESGPATDPETSEARTSVGTIQSQRAESGHSDERTPVLTTLAQSLVDADGTDTARLAALLDAYAAIAAANGDDSPALDTVKALIIAEVEGEDDG